MTRSARVRSASSSAVVASCIATPTASAISTSVAGCGRARRGTSRASVPLRVASLTGFESSRGRPPAAGVAVNGARTTGEHLDRRAATPAEQPAERARDDLRSERGRRGRRSPPCSGRSPWGWRWRSRSTRRGSPGAGAPSRRRAGGRPRAAAALARRVLEADGLRRGWWSTPATRWCWPTRPPGGWASSAAAGWLVDELRRLARRGPPATASRGRPMVDARAAGSAGSRSRSACRSPPLGRVRLRGAAAGRRHRDPPGGEGAPRLRRQRQPRAEDARRRAAPCSPRRCRTRPTTRRRSAASPAGCSTRPPGSAGSSRELIELSRLQGAEPLPTPDGGRRRRGGRRGGRPHPAPRPSARHHRWSPAAQQRLTVRGSEQPAGHRADQPARQRRRVQPARTPGSRSARAAATGLVEITVSDQGIGIAEQGPGRGSSSASTGPTRPGPEPPAAPGSAWPSSSTSPPTTAAASRCGAWRAPAPPSPCACRRRGRTAASEPVGAGRRCAVSLQREEPRDPRARGGGRGVVLRRAVVHAAPGGLRGRRGRHRPGRAHRVRPGRRRPRAARPHAARAVRHRGLPARCGSGPRCRSSC